MIVHISRDRYHDVLNWLEARLKRPSIDMVALERARQYMIHNPDGNHWFFGYGQMNISDLDLSESDKLLFKLIFHS